MHNPIAYTYDADYHCPECTAERFGRCNGDHVYVAGRKVTADHYNRPAILPAWIEAEPGYHRTGPPRGFDTPVIACTAEHFDGYTAVDSEGNPPGVVAPWDEWHWGEEECEALYCGTCGRCIEYFHGDQCPDTGTATTNPISGRHHYSPLCVTWGEHAEHVTAIRDTAEATRYSERGRAIRQHERDRAITAAHQAGLSLRDIGEIADLSHETVRRIIGRHR